MTVTYHAGRRIQGLDADRTATQLPSGSVGGWVEVGRTTLGSSNSNINVTSLSNKRYYMILCNSVGRSGTSDNGFYRDGNGSYDSGSNYARRNNKNGAADQTSTSATANYGVMVPALGSDLFVGYIANLSGNEKLYINHQVNSNTAGASNAPIRHEQVQKHAFTSNPIDQLQFFTDNVDTYDTGSEVVVLGWDPADTHTNNFWQKLGTTSWSSGDDIDVTFTGSEKKYLWFQGYATLSGAGRTNIRVGDGSVATSNYAYRRWHGSTGSEETFTSADRMGATSGNIDTIDFWNGFIINNSGNEKLMIAHCVRGGTAGAANAPERTEIAGKYAYTSGQLDRIRLYNDTAGVDLNGGQLTVWGAD